MLEQSQAIQPGSLTVRWLARIGHCICTALCPIILLANQRLRADAFPSPQTLWDLSSLLPRAPPPAHLRLCMELVSRHHVVSAVTCFTGGLGCRWRLGGPPSVKPRALHTNQFTMPLIDCYWRRIRLCSLLDTYPG